MNNILSLEELLNLPKEVLKISGDYDEYSGLIQKDQFHKYDFVQLKKEICELFDKYNNAKYFYDNNAEYNIKVTSSYELREHSFCNTISNPIESLVKKKVDEEIWTQSFYDKILQISHKLTLQEAIYFVDAFFANRSEELISEKLGISRNTLQNIKKSCLIKTWFELETLN